MTNLHRIPLVGGLLASVLVAWSETRYHPGFLESTPQCVEDGSCTPQEVMAQIAQHQLWLAVALGVVALGVLLHIARGRDHQRVFGRRGVGGLLAVALLLGLLLAYPVVMAMFLGESMVIAAAGAALLVALYARWVRSTGSGTAVA